VHITILFCFLWKIAEVLANSKELQPQEALSKTEDEELDIMKPVEKLTIWPIEH
jgi:hypothetical protein